MHAVSIIAMLIRHYSYCDLCVNFYIMIENGTKIILDLYNHLLCIANLARDAFEFNWTDDVADR